MKPLLLSLLFTACSDPQAEALKQLTAKGYSLSTEQFFQAAREGDAAALRLFLAAGMAPGVKDAQGRTALNEAVTKGRLQAVEVLLASGAALPPQKACEVLAEAVRSHQVPVLHALLDAGIKPGAGSTISPLVVAASERQSEMIDLLAPLSLGHEKAALIVAAETGDVAVLSCLLKQGAPVTVRDEATDRTPLLLAAARGYTSLVEMLLASGADRMAVDGAGRSALDLAREGGHQAIVAMLARDLTGDEQLTPEKLQGRAIRLGSTMAVAPGEQWVFLGCHEETLPWQLETLSEQSAQLRSEASASVKEVAVREVVPGTDWMLKVVQPAGLFSRPCALFRDRETWKHLLLVQGVPARRGRLCAWLQRVADRTVYEAAEGDRFSMEGEQMVPLRVAQVSTMKVVFVHEANAGQSWTLTPGGMR